MSHRTPRSVRLLRAALVLTLLGALLLPTGAVASLEAKALDAAVTPVERFLTEVGTRTGLVEAAAPDLNNFTHLFNHNPGGPIGAARGTDVEFYSPVVPRRDYTTGEIALDANGQPIMEQRDFAVMGAYDRGGFVYDITNPESPQFVKRIVCNQQQNDVQIKQFGDRWVLALARDGGANPCVNPQKGHASAMGGIAVFDITDPYEYKPMYSFRVADGAHNFTFHPTKPFGYVSTGDLPGGIDHIPVIDFTDVDNPTLAADPQIEGGPHDISFNPDGSRAYVAAENNMRIYDTTDPKAPRQLSISVGPASYVHGADPTPDGKHVILTDESLVLGGFFTQRKSVCPGGGITMYNVEGANETQPRPEGFAVADIQGVDTENMAACTAHVGRITANSKYYVTGWYRGGVRVFDLSNPQQPADIGHAMMPGSEGYAGEVWAAKFYKGDYVYSADMRRGFDVFKWTGPTLGNPEVTAPAAP